MVQVPQPCFNGKRIAHNILFILHVALLQKRVSRERGRRRRRRERGEKEERERGERGRGEGPRRTRGKQICKEDKVNEMVKKANEGKTSAHLNHKLSGWSGHGWKEEREKKEWKQG